MIFFFCFLFFHKKELVKEPLLSRDRPSETAA